MNILHTNMAGRGTDILLGGNAEYLAKAELRRAGYEEDVVQLATGSLQNISEEALNLFLDEVEELAQATDPSEKTDDAVFIVSASW